MIRLDSSEAVRSWRGRGGTIAVVAGTFDLLHPGNLAALRRARSAADRVVALVDPDAAAGQSGGPQNTQEVRGELLANVRGIDAVALVGDAGRSWVEALRPCRWVTRGGARVADPLADALAAGADSVIVVDDLPECSAHALRDAINAGRTPIRVPAQLYPAPSSDVVPPELLAGERPLVTVNGCFDILHVGHIRFLAQARDLGARLIVLTNDDASVARYKGPTRPVFPIGFRAAALAALRTVDAVIPFSGDNPLEAIRRLRPDIHVKGGSYEPDRVREERELVESWGGRLVCTDLVRGYSTTEFIRKAASGRAE